MTPVNNGEGAVAGSLVEAKKPSKARRYFQRNNQKPVATGTTRVAVKQPKFEGKNENLKGHIYNCSDARQSDLFTKTTKAIS
jgi:hypothetical protein